MASSRFPAVTSCFVSMHQLDQSLEAFAADQFVPGASKYVFTCALQNANVEYPCWPASSWANYPLSKSAKKGWTNLEPGASRDPCPFEVACLIADDMLENEGAHFSAAVVNSFHTDLRPGKLCELVRSNVIPPTNMSRYAFWTLLLHPQESGVPSKVGELNDSLVFVAADRL